MSRDREPKEETPHITAVKKQWQLRQQAAQKPRFKIVDGKFVPHKVSPPADDLATTVAAAEEEEFLRNPQPGEQFADKGIFIGVWEPTDRDGNSLGKIFNVFAAPEDLTDDSGNKGTYKYVDAVKRLAALKNWHGHDGTHYAIDKELYKALKDGSYKDGWIIPTRELLVGTEADGPSGVRKGTIVQPDNLFDHQNTGALKDTFMTAVASGYGYSQRYLSCTEERGDPYNVWSVDFSDSRVGRPLKNGWQLSCRPVRLEPRP